MDKDSIILKIINCTSAAELREKLRAWMSDAPNIDLLHESLHSAIHKDKLYASQLLAVTIQLTAKKEDRLQVWKDILEGGTTDTLNKAMVKPFTWEKYFAEDIARRKKKNQKARNESVLHLHKSGKISLFEAFHYPKLFFTLIKLGADPFVLNSSNENLSLAIVRSSTLNRSSRLHILEYMLKHKLLQIKASGRDDTSPLEVCVATRKECVKYFVQVPGIEDFSIKGRMNAVAFVGTHAPKAMKYFSVAQMVKVLEQRTGDNKLLATQFNMSTMKYPRNFLLALKEVVNNNPIFMPDLKAIRLPEKLITFFIFDGKPDPEQDFLTEKIRQMRLEQFWGITEFDLAALPAELLEMVTDHLGSVDQVRLFSLSKALKEMMTDYHWQQMMKNDTPLLHKQLELDTTTTWRQKTASRVKAGHNWKLGKAVAKRLKTQPAPRQIYPRQIDEHWLASTLGKKVRFFNLTDGSQKITKVNDEPNIIEYMPYTHQERPNFIFKAWQHFGLSTPDQLAEVKYSDIGVPEASRCLFNLSDYRVLVGPNSIYDFNRQQALPITPSQQLHAVRYNPLNNTIAAIDSGGNLVIKDKDLNNLTKSALNLGITPAINQPGKIEVIDDYTLLAISGKSIVIDIRNMKSLLTVPAKVYYNGAGRGLELMQQLAGLVWNFKTLQSESCVIFPDSTRIDYCDMVCNSKMAVFSTAVPYGLNALLF